MADRDNLIAQFSAVSGVDSERARFFLESAAWNLESALSSFYEEGEGGEEDLGDRPEAEGAPSTPQRPTLQPPPQARFNMMDGDSSDDEGQAFYAGGSEHSGQQVLGPSKKGKGDVVAQLFKSAKEHGAEVLDSTKSKKGKGATFKGTGYRLGMTDDDTQVIPGHSQEDRTPRDVMLKMWKTGFTVDGGPLRLYEDPANAEFLNSVRRSEVPLELIKEARGGEVFINMADHRHEDYVQPKAAAKAFVGTGHTLGSPAPNVVGQVVQTGTAGGAIGASVVEGTPSDPKACEQNAQSEIKVDSSLPTTNIQVRLTDGSRLVLKLNHNHTVGDIRRYVCIARPMYQASPFALMTTFPHAELSDDSKTVAEAKLLNSAIVLKTK